MTGSHGEGISRISSHPQDRRPLRALPAALLLASALLLGGCSLVSEFLAVDRAVRDAGVDASEVRLETGDGRTVLTVGYDSRAGTRPEQAAGALWAKAPVRFDELRLAPSGQPVRTFTRAQLQAQHGPRPAGLDSRGLAGEGGILRDLLVVGLVGVAALALLAVAVRGIGGRRRRRRVAPPDGWPPHAGW